MLVIIFTNQDAQPQAALFQCSNVCPNPIFAYASYSAGHTRDGGSEAHEMPTS